MYKIDKLHMNMYTVSLSLNIYLQDKSLKIKNNNKLNKTVCVTPIQTKCSHVADPN